MDNHALFLAVLIQVVFDIRSQSKKSRPVRFKKRAEYWFNYDKMAFDWVCLRANVEPGKTRKALQELIDMDAKTFHDRMAVASRRITPKCENT